MSGAGTDLGDGPTWPGPPFSMIILTIFYKKNTEERFYCKDTFNSRPIFPKLPPPPPSLSLSLSLSLSKSFGSAPERLHIILDKLKVYIVSNGQPAEF